jgi:membrane protease YdiL (CAAX protease family)
MQSVSLEARVTSRQDLALIGCVFFLIFSFIWFLRGSSRWATPIFSLLLSAALIYGHVQRGQSLRDVGFRLDTGPAAALRLVPIAAVIIAFAMHVGHVLGSAHFPTGLEAVANVAKLIVFGTAQQYVLLGVFYQRLAEMLPGKVLAMIAAAVVFSVLHVPNPFLVTVTFFAGLISTIVYARAPNLWVNGTVHGLMSYCLYYSLSVDITGGLRVGSPYWEL